MACVDAVRRAGSARQPQLPRNVAGGAGAEVNAAFALTLEGENVSGLTALPDTKEHSGVCRICAAVWFWR